MKTGFVTLVACALSCATAPAAQAADTPAPRAAATCEPVAGLSFVCGLKGPEDMVRIPGTRFLIAGGVVPGGDLHLVDTDAKAQVPFYVGGAQVQPDKALYPQCPGAPDPARFSAHGLALRAGKAQGLYRLYVVSHGDVEGIQVFALDARGAAPALAWKGCVPFSAGVVGNAVTAFSDGTILATARGKLDHVGPTIDGVTGGVIVSWKPGEAGFHALPGTELSGPNGLEASPDEREFYVAAVGTQSVLVFSRSDPGHPLRQARAPLTSLDNLRWTDGHLIAAGMIADEPACGGTRHAIIAHGGDAHACIRGYAAVELDPATMDWRVVAYAEPNPVFGGVATAIPMGATLWLSSYNTDRIAYRPLPAARP